MAAYVAAYYARNPDKLADRRRWEKLSRDRKRHSEDPDVREAFLAKERARNRAYLDRLQILHTSDPAAREQFLVKQRARRRAWCQRRKLEQQHVQEASEFSGSSQPAAHTQPT